MFLLSIGFSQLTQDALIITLGVIHYLFLLRPDMRKPASAQTILADMGGHFISTDRWTCNVSQISSIVDMQSESQQCFNFGF